MSNLHIKQLGGIYPATPPIEFKDFHDPRFFAPAPVRDWGISFNTRGQARIYSKVSSDTLWGRAHCGMVVFIPAVFPDPNTGLIKLECDIENLNIGSSAFSTSTYVLGFGIAMVMGDRFVATGIGRAGTAANRRMSMIYADADVAGQDVTSANDTADRIATKYTIRHEMEFVSGGTSYRRFNSWYVSLDGAAPIAWTSSSRPCEDRISPIGLRIALIGFVNEQIRPSFEATFTALRIIEGSVIFM